MTHTKRLDYKMLTFASSCSISSAMVSKTCPELPTTEFSELEKRHAEVTTVAATDLTPTHISPDTRSFCISMLHRHCNAHIHSGPGKEIQCLENCLSAQCAKHHRTPTS